MYICTDLLETLTERDFRRGTQGGRPRRGGAEDELLARAIAFRCAKRMAMFAAEAEVDEIET